MKWKQILKWIAIVFGALISLVLLLVVALLLGVHEKNWFNDIGEIQDEALQVGRKADTFPAATEDYFKDMDRGVELTSNEIKGRNTWIVWTGGNDRFWDFMANNTFGAFDLLKILSNHPSLYYSRDNRWKYLGLVNEPCFKKGKGPQKDRFGLWLDVRQDDCPKDPFENEKKEEEGGYPGVKIGARDRFKSVGSYYGEATGIVGLRLFPNPDFDEEAEKEWDAKRYYADPEYYQDKNLVRPYRVGMSCGFCHVGPSPINPPADPENPEWENLTSNPGAQYFWVDRIFFWNNRPRSTYSKDKAGYSSKKSSVPTENERNFVFQWFHTNPPGALDTSFVSTDNINNPRTMNAVYSLMARLGPAEKERLVERWGQEELAGGELNNAQFQDFPQTNVSPFKDFYKNPVVHTPRVLKDGSDSAGALGALNRVYLNIGLFSEEWLEHFRPLIGGIEISPIEIAVAKENSTYWNATVQQTPDMALFFLKTAQPDLLEKAPGRNKYLIKDKKILRRGKIVFAENCARCHSSKIPEAPADVDGGKCEGGGNGPDYLECWNQYWEWTHSKNFKQKMTQMVLDDNFLDENFLSTERRVPSTLLKTNMCSPLATNAIENDIWDNFSASTYKNLPAVGTVPVNHPLTGVERPYEMPGGGRGYTRPASLIGLWSTAPFLQNNSVGTFDPNPSVERRMAVFNDSIEKMLWPEKRKKDIDVIKEIGLSQTRAVDLPGYMYRTTAASCLMVPNGYLPDLVQTLAGWKLSQYLLPWVLDEKGNVKVGPIPKGTPVNLITNLQILPETDDTWEAIKHRWKVLQLGRTIAGDLSEIGGACSDEDLRDTDKQQEALEVYLESGLVDDLIALSKCPDYVVNRGHYFGTDLSNRDKRALIEFLKYF